MSNLPEYYRKRWTQEENEKVNIFADSLSSQQELAERGPDFAASMGRPVSTVQYKVEKRRNWYSRNTNRN
ncbi:hypothetical protein PUW24_07245 [Paenibacillus urinalis]|uniref:Uncharacterized protein n=1 Tax=Paenibacillus urinalis TaxID=521520 RepID=A0ABY7XC25_9BACL|nr:hypothetical protein [Paenibacillus urinalis]WDH98706.1 hypothetical protein PUW24_07245 [Paenibacillus urinalis]WDI02399.1 hypothetical protein PUW25_24965 [Paenibacillus urinalis]